MIAKRMSISRGRQLRRQGSQYRLDVTELTVIEVLVARLARLTQAPAADEDLVLG